MNPIQIPSDGGKKVNILGIPMVIRIHGRDTSGVVSAVESHDVPGGGPPPHIHHREDETFQVLEGEYEWTVGGKTFIAKKGATIFAPRGIPHTYRYLGQTPGRLMCVITPAGFKDSSRKSARSVRSNSRKFRASWRLRRNLDWRFCHHRVRDWLLTTPRKPEKKSSTWKLQIRNLLSPRKQGYQRPIGDV